VKTEGFSALFYGYRATLWRDLPFSALQFAFYEQEQKWAKNYVGSKTIGLPLEILTAASAGGMAGVLTCPLDVVKTRIQTQHNPDATPVSKSSPATSSLKPPSPHVPVNNTNPAPVKPPPHQHTRPISTSSPSTALKNHSAVTLDTSSVMTGLKMIYKTEGFSGWFRGVGPRLVWTSVQSGTMLVLYQTLLRFFDEHPLVAKDVPVI
jgi:hypothetical protein